MAGEFEPVSIHGVLLKVCLLTPWDVAFILKVTFKMLKCKELNYFFNRNRWLKNENDVIVSVVIMLFIICMTFFCQTWKFVQTWHLFWSCRHLFLQLRASFQVEKSVNFSEKNALRQAPFLQRTDDKRVASRFHNNKNNKKKKKIAGGRQIVLVSEHKELENCWKHHTVSFLV